MSLKLEIYVNEEVNNATKSESSFIFYFFSIVWAIILFDFSILSLSDILVGLYTELLNWIGYYLF